MTDWIRSPLNYTGSKHRYLDEIFETLPTDKSLRFCDVFGGGASVVANAKFTSRTYNDKNKDVAELMRSVQSGRVCRESVTAEVQKRGLSKDNRDAYEQLRRDFSASRDSLLLYLCIRQCFNCLMRFNDHGDFNQAFGFRTPNEKSMKELEEFHEALQGVRITNIDFRETDWNAFDVFYFDPPYTGTAAGYQAGSGAWSARDDEELFETLLELDAAGKTWLFSNQTVAKGVKNHALLDFLEKRKWRVRELDSGTYKTATYHRKDAETIEVLVSNRGDSKSLNGAEFSEVW